MAAASVSLGRRRGKDAADEQDLVRVLVAEPGDVALILERDVDGARSSAPSRRAASAGSQSSDERIRAEVPDEPLLVARSGRP